MLCYLVVGLLLCFVCLIDVYSLRVMLCFVFCLFYNRVFDCVITEQLGVGLLLLTAFGLLMMLVFSRLCCLDLLSVCLLLLGGCVL